jgi:hypothetical protein
MTFDPSALSKMVGIVEDDAALRTDQVGETGAFATLVSFVSHGASI